MQFLDGRELPRSLTPDEEKRLIDAMLAGDKESRNKLIVHNLRLVMLVAGRYRDCGVEMEELFSIGCLALTKAVDTFDAEKRVKVGTWAALLIEMDFIRQVRHMRAQKRTAQLLPIDAKIPGENRNGNTFADVLPDTKSHDAMQQAENRQTVERLLSDLPEREARCMRCLYGLEGESEKNQVETAQEMGFSQPTIVKMQKRAIRRMRFMMREATA